MLCSADLVTGQIVDRLKHHNQIVRDCSWHPHEQEVRSVLLHCSAVCRVLCMMLTVIPGEKPANNLTARWCS